MFFPSCIDSEVIVVTIKDNNITITVKNMVVVNNEASSIFNSKFSH